VEDEFGMLWLHHQNRYGKRITKLLLSTILKGWLASHGHDAGSSGRCSRRTGWRAGGCSHER